MTIAQLLEKWEARSRDALPSDAMLINKHIRELREAVAQPPVTVLPYMGPPTEPAKKHRKSAEAIGDGTHRTQPRIREFEE